MYTVSLQSNDGDTSIEKSPKSGGYISIKQIGTQ
jgi:hypothetical protein